MADNTIDSLEIKIESSADQAVRSLENLSAKLTTIKNTLGNTNVGFDLSGISKTMLFAEIAMVMRIRDIMYGIYRQICVYGKVVAMIVTMITYVH